MHESVADAALAAEYGLKAEEWKTLVAILGRAPTPTELGIFSVMWSEHFLAHSLEAQRGAI